MNLGGSTGDGANIRLVDGSVKSSARSIFASTTKAETSRHNFHRSRNSSVFKDQLFSWMCLVFALGALVGSCLGGAAVWYDVHCEADSQHKEVPQ